MSIFKIAVTGSAGSGKSLVCMQFSELGLTIFDCDKIARLVVEPGEPAYNNIIELFGKDIIFADGSLNRPELRKIISNDVRMRKSLENIVHPAILDSLFFKIKKIEARDEKCVVVEVPLLFESNLMVKFDYIVTVVGQDKDLVARIMMRDQVSKKEAQDILNIQLPQKEKVERADFVIWNTSGIGELKGSVDTLYEKIKKEYLT
jgi:dephospho-CoA kinase